jgi:tetratricopeptide (TPR) repeat protein
MLRAVILGLVLAATVARAPTAAAQPAPVDPAMREQAAAHVRQAREFFKTAQWDRALAEYQAALDLTGEPLLTFNIALVHDRAGRPELALDSFQRYLALEPLGKVADEARENVARLTPIVDKIRADRAAAEAAAAESARRAEAARAAEAARQAAAAARARSAAGAERSHRRTWWGAVGLAVAGGAALAVGAKYGLDARDAEAFISSHRGPWTDDVLARDTQGRSANTRFIVLTAAGGAAVVGSGVLYLLSRRAGARAARLRLEVAPTAGGAAAVLTGAF